MSDTEQHDVERGLIVSFEDQDPRYTYGFEAGMIWQQMQDGAERFEQVVRSENCTTIKRMCEAEGYGCDLEGCETEGWMMFIAWKRSAKPPKFRLVEGGLKDDT